MNYRVDFRVLTLLTTWILSGTATPGSYAAIQGDVAPAIPLIACDPYFSIWSTTSQLTDSDTTHWTGKPHRISALVRIDGQVYRIMGLAPQEFPPLEQTKCELTATQTKYAFAGAGIALQMRFVTPALPYDIDILSRPVTYLQFAVKSLDGAHHDVQILVSASAEIATNFPDQAVAAVAEHPGDLVVLKVGSHDQALLETQGDDHRIDWGYLYLAASNKECNSCATAAQEALVLSFQESGELPDIGDNKSDRADQLAAGLILSFGNVGQATVQRSMTFAYDDLYSIEYMGTPLRPYWRRNNRDAATLLIESAQEREKLLQECDAFDQELSTDMLQAGGKEFEAIGTLAYRQCFAAGKFVVDANGQPLQFCKENHSNGCIATSDVFYPMAPQFMLFGSSLAKSFVVPFMEYAASDRWKFPFAPHDLGTYPKANGQVYGGGERTEDNQMPVEESGNLLILMAAIAEMDGNADFAERYWPQLEKWANYLRQEGFDPANQLCTDDFAGHLAHNVNLSAKAICGLGAYAKLCQLKGDTEQASEFRRIAEEYVKRWITEAEDGDHFRLAFDKPGTWSQKYNLVWDRVLGLNLFPEGVFEKEMDYYRRKQNQFGLPLDNRKDYTKLDWILWTATLTQESHDFQALVSPVYRFLQETPDKSPLTDWYETKSAKKVGFTARPVVGGVFMKLLHDQVVWKKWASRDRTRAQGFATMPAPPTLEVIVPTAREQPGVWRFTTSPPPQDWFATDFDDSAWAEGMGGFGTDGTPGAHIGTKWDTPQIWLRRTVDFGSTPPSELRFCFHHDEDAEVYINGILMRKFSGYQTDYSTFRLGPDAIEAIRPKGNVVAVTCRQTTGGQYIDLGFAALRYPERTPR